MTRLENKVAIVTGASSGIGRAIALRYAHEGAKVVCADLTLHPHSEDATPTHEAIQQTGGQAIFQQTDVSNTAQMQSLVQSAVSAYGRLDILANNAGIGTGGREPSALHEADEELWDDTMRVNSKSVFLGCKYALVQMLQQDPHPSGDRGWIVNVSSIASLIAIEGIGPYSASKGAVSSLTRQAALDYAPHRIHINAICPGFVRTPILLAAATDPALADEYHRRHPFGGIGETEYIAAMAVVLASDDARWMTGVVLPVDGGYTVR
ncbi:SDR family NAD(P)-dependent oxidoreductase [Aspergillus glaucus CBS 516.65]|uniref:Uncharacterized protein n=1 Tax=Aspergillus glaucus CBS 516.65 TaxID=1160497 RepID=A0A1L9VQU6_ASPGL|nr:hypothetical protein ASPGLDRAFT_34158 [Aspergillus glaucus CBS 516.65]OJJ86276.1 hypothetical protein ASPGLDRAFT_34158 [Aspergillus glaucus CBS 516.65]